MVDLCGLEVTSAARLKCIFCIYVIVGLLDASVCPRTTKSSVFCFFVNILFFFGFVCLFVTDTIYYKSMSPTPSK
jgi:hypothetical protein